MVPASPCGLTVTEPSVGHVDIPPITVEDGDDGDEQCTADPLCTGTVVSGGDDWSVCEYHARLLCLLTWETGLPCDELWHEEGHPHHVASEKASSATWN